MTSNGDELLTNLEFTDYEKSQIRAIVMGVFLRFLVGVILISLTVLGVYFTLILEVPIRI